MKLSRRHFLAGTAGLAAASIWERTARARGFLPTRQLRAKAVVIGSGFGGAVAALRLSEAGLETLVLERGRRWEVSPAGNTFCTLLHPDQRSTWLRPFPVFPGSPPALFSPYVGLIDRIEGDGMNILCGAGVGGSSLVMGSIMVQPPQPLFERVLPGIPYCEMDTVYYPRVRDVVGSSPIPDDVVAHPRYQSTRLFRHYATAAGFGGTLMRPGNNVDWDIVRRELAGQAVPSLTIGEGTYGNNSGGKNSVDRNYLRRAEQSGHVEVAPLHVVHDIAEAPEGTFEVRCHRISEDGVPLEQVLVRCEHLFLAAGAGTTPRLLVRARATGTLPRLNADVGRLWGNNGDQFFLLSGVSQPAGAPQGGPVSYLFRDQPAAGPAMVQHIPLPLPAELYTLAVLAMAHPQPLGEFRYNPLTGEVRLYWPVAAEQESKRAVAQTVARLRAASGGVLIDQALLYGASTIHPLGGAVLGRACDWFGRVRGYRSLYVVDGSLLPGSAGCSNPALTIAALAEWCLDHLLSQGL